MTRTKKLVCGTRKALDKEIKIHKAKGWTVERTESWPRGSLTGKRVYLGWLKKNEL